MRLTSLIKYGTAVFVLLAVATAAGLTWLYQSLAAQNNALVYQAEFQRTVEELVELPGFLNEQPRRYVFNGDPAIKEAWQQAVASRPHRTFCRAFARNRCTAGRTRFDRFHCSGVYVAH